MTAKSLCALCSFKRPGASLVNVCVFFLAATMMTAQVFFFSTTTSETLAEEAKSLERSFSMGQKLRRAFTVLQSPDITSAPVSEAITFAKNIGIAGKGTLYAFNEKTSVWSDDAQQIYIYNLNYTLRTSIRYARSKNVAARWKAVPITKRIFPPMGANRFLVRLLAPAQGLGKKLMYQVVVKRDTSVIPYKIEPLTFKEVWYE